MTQFKRKVPEWRCFVVSSGRFFVSRRHFLWLTKCEILGDFVIYFQPCPQIITGRSPTTQIQQSRLACWYRYTSINEEVHLNIRVDHGRWIETAEGSYLNAER